MRKTLVLNKKPVVFILALDLSIKQALSLLSSKIEYLILLLFPVNMLQGFDNKLFDSVSRLSISDGTLKTSDGTLKTSDGTLKTSDRTLKTSDRTLKTSDGTLKTSDRMLLILKRILTIYKMNILTN